MPDRDLERLRDEYARRRYSSADQARYSVFNKANLFALQQRQRTLLSLLQQHNISSLVGKRILEVGCGRGGVLLEYLGYGAEAGTLVGIDLLLDRLLEGHRRLSGLQLACADGQKLPFASGHFDLVLQYTAFSSVLDPQVKASMASDMLRVLRSNGLIIWYDFWLNPTNPQTRGIRRSEIEQLFPNCTCVFKRVTLAPPIARRLVPISWMAAGLVEKLGMLNSHYLVAIRPRQS